MQAQQHIESLWTWSDKIRLHCKEILVTLCWGCKMPQKSAKTAFEVTYTFSSVGEVEMTAGQGGWAADCLAWAAGISPGILRDPQLNQKDLLLRPFNKVCAHWLSGASDSIVLIAPIWLIGAILHDKYFSFLYLKYNLLFYSLYFLFGFDRWLATSTTTSSSSSSSSSAPTHGNAT